MKKKITDSSETFHLTKENWNKFIEFLDNPPKPNEALKKLMNSKPTWEE